MSNKRKDNCNKTSAHSSMQDNLDIKKIEGIIKKAKTVHVTMYKTCLPGGSHSEKFVAYTVYKIGELEASDNIVSYKGKTFPDSKIISMMKKRAVELNPEAVEKCRQEAEKWKNSVQIHGTEHTK